jgi:hypothetical protein
MRQGFELPEFNPRQGLNSSLADLMMYVEANQANILWGTMILAEARVINNAIQREHQFVTISNERHLHLFGARMPAVTGSNANNLYRISGTNIGVFRYGVHGNILLR